ncbi:MAG: DUF1273 domain-containing protein [Oscillospiraceae bacterium]|nr:DUF1273 domain-containing protein [Ruminococcus sp.]MDE6708682.1 DUF1273 domain-containing protein [Oscillospiraceae bacterium]
MTCTIISSGDELKTVCQNESEAPFINMKVKLHEYIWNLYTKGYDKFYLNCDYGIPLWAAEFILSLKAGNQIALHIMIPYEEQTTDWTEELRNRYFAIHEKADSVTLANTRYYPSCYQDTDKQMIDKSDILVIFEEKNSVAPAETYAKENNIPIAYMPVF